MGLEARYEAAQQNEEVITAKIVSAFETFAAQTPSFQNTNANRAKMFEVMEEMRVEEGANPTRATDWSDAYSKFLFLYDQPRTVARRRPSAAPVSGLTLAEINGWTAVELKKQIESSPRREAEIEAALSRR